MEAISIQLDVSLLNTASGHEQLARFPGRHGVASVSQVTSPPASGGYSTGTSAWASTGASQSDWKETAQTAITAPLAALLACRHLCVHSVLFPGSLIRPPAGPPARPPAGPPLRPPCREVPASRSRTLSPIVGIDRRRHLCVHLASSHSDRRGVARLGAGESAAITSALARQRFPRNCARACLQQRRRRSTFAARCSVVVGGPHGTPDPQKEADAVRPDAQGGPDPLTFHRGQGGSTPHPPSQDRLHLLASTTVAGANKARNST
jgi:hypothetical protein